MSFSKLLQQTKRTSKRFATFPGEAPRDQFSIFKPILENKIRFVLTWNIGEVWRFEPIFKELKRLSQPFHLIVGYGNFTAEETYNRIKVWQKEFPQFNFNLARNMHTKAWIGDEEIWVGSANFVPNMVTNLMIKAPESMHKQLRPLCFEGVNISHSTNPKLVTAKRNTPEILNSKILLQ